MAGSLGQKGRSLLSNHWEPTDQSGIESQRAISAGEIAAPPFSDQSRRRARAFIRCERRWPARLSCDSCKTGIQFDQLAAQLARTAQKVACAILISPPRVNTYGMVPAIEFDAELHTRQENPSWEGLSYERDFAIPDCGRCVRFVCSGSHLWLLKFACAHSRSARGLRRDEHRAFFRGWS